VKLYDYWRSSSAWRVRIALRYKGVAYQSLAVNLIEPGARAGDRRGQQHQPAFLAVNPLSQVPVLELDGDDAGAGPARTIAQSLAILEYLEERFPSPPLLPAEPWLRARARQLAEMVNAGTQPFQTLGTIDYVQEHLGGDKQGWIQHFVGRGLGALEKAAGETAATFLVGDAPSFADACLVPQLYVARRFGLALDDFPTLLRAEAACAALLAFADAHPDRQPDKPPT
jgi:maleylpyruvate isomerase